MRSLAPGSSGAGSVTQLAKFAIVGVGNTLVSLAVYSAVGSAAVAFAVGAVNGYVFNARWTFRSHGSLLRYLVVQLAGLGLTVLITRALVYFIALPVVTLATFAANRSWAFTTSRASAARTTPRPE